MPALNTMLLSLFFCFILQAVGIYSMPASAALLDDSSPLQPTSTSIVGSVRTHSTMRNHVQPSKITPYSGLTALPGSLTMQNTSVVTLSHPTTTSSFNATKTTRSYAPASVLKTQPLLPLSSGSCEGLTQPNATELKKLAKQWAYFQAKEEMKQFEEVWNENGLLCAECRGLSRQKCQDYLNYTLPESCSRTIREVGLENFYNGALVWFSHEPVGEKAICNLCSPRPPPPSCNETFGPGSYLILQSMRNVVDYFNTVYIATKDAQESIANRVPSIFKAVLWPSEQVETTTVGWQIADQVLSLGAEIMGNVTPDWIDGTDLLLTIWPQKFKTIKSIMEKVEKERARQEEFKEETVHADLELFTNMLTALLEDVTFPLLKNGSYFDPYAEWNYPFSEVMEDGRYAVPQHVAYSEALKMIEINIERSIRLTSYRRQKAYKFFFTPSTEGQVDMMYQIGDEHWLKSFCNREQNVTEWSKPLLVPVVGDARNLDPRRKFCEARKPSAYKGDPLAWPNVDVSTCFNGTCYRPMLARATGDACYISPLIGVHGKFMHQWVQNHTTFNDVMDPLLRESVLFHQDPGIDWLPLPVMNLTVNYRPKKKYLVGEMGRWGICDYKAWNKQRGLLPIAYRCPNLDLPGCEYVGLPVQDYV